MSIPFEKYSELVQEHLERVHGIRVVTRDVEDPLIGDLDGAEIHIDYAVSPEQRLFLLAHLFGHTVQWNANPNGVELGRPRRPPVPASEIPALMEYERQAASYALSMLHEIGITDVDQWLSDFTACDTAYLQHFYVTGEKRDFQSFWRIGTRTIDPTPIPEFRPAKRAWRSGGIVI
ncbi:MAG: hypothetical protein WDO18_02525 [Acidobacteriota bacterium]